MSDVSQGPGWWQASDGKWYSPEHTSAGQAPATYPSGSPTGPLASWGTRVLATLIDAAVSTALLIVGFILVFIVGAISSTLGVLLGLVVYLVSIAAGLYFTYMTGACGQSPGKKIMGIKVVNEETGQVIGGGMGIVRGLAHFVDSFVFGLGYLWPLWDPKRQTLADKIMTSAPARMPWTK